MDIMRDLIMLADILDVSGLHTEAGEIDLMVKRAAEIHDIIQRRVDEEMPHEEPSPQVIQFMQDLERALESQVSANGPITYDAKEAALGIAQNLIRQNIYPLPGASRAGLSMALKSENEILTLVDGIIELEDELSEKGAYEGTETAEREYADSFDKLNKLYGIVQKIKNGGRAGDPETYRLIVDYYNQRRGKEVW